MSKTTMSKMSEWMWGMISSGEESHAQRGSTDSGYLSRAQSMEDEGSSVDELELNSEADFGGLGLRMEEAEIFRQIAQEKGWHIFVRSGNMARTRNVGRPGMRPKPAGVYQKTSKGSYMPGMVGYEAEEDVKGMHDVHHLRHPDEDAPNSLQVLSQEGYSLRDLGEGLLGLRDEAQNFIYGDIDIHGVYKEDGSPQASLIDANTFVPLFNDRLIATGLHSRDLLEYGTVAREKDFGVQPWSPIQHGAHDEWDRRNDTTYVNGVNMGPLPGVIHFSPDPQMTPSFIGTTGLYQRELGELGVEDTYTSEAWNKGSTRS